MRPHADALDSPFGASSTGATRAQVTTEPALIVVHPQGPVQNAVLGGPELANLLARLAATGAHQRVSLGEMIDALGPSHRSLLLLLPALLAFSPATIVFGVATICGLMIAVVSLQLLIRREGVWLPRFVRKASLKRTVLRRAVAWLDGPLAWVGSRARPRCPALVSGPLARLPIVMAAVLGMALPFLELVPLSATSAGLAITLMVLGLVLRDGLLTLAGMAMSAVVVIFASKLAGGSLKLLSAV